jgi:hypothetical protein
MPIQEALKRFDTATADRFKTPYNFYSLRSEEICNKQIAFLLESGVLNILEELTHFISLEFPDVQGNNAWIHPYYRGKSRNNLPDPKTVELESHGGLGNVSISVGWNYNLPADPEKERAFNLIQAMTTPITGSIIILGEDEYTIPRNEWKGKKGSSILEDAIVSVHHSPAIASWNI